MFTTDILLESSGLPERTHKDVPRIINRLLGQTFLYQDVEADKDDYYTVSRHRPVFEAALGLAGFTLLHDDYHRIFQVVSDYSYCRARHKLDESLLIVVLRKLYEEQAEQLRLAADPVEIGPYRVQPFELVKHGNGHRIVDEETGRHGG